MKESRFSEAQIVGILKEVEMGAKVAETCRKHGVSEPTYYIYGLPAMMFYFDRGGDTAAIAHRAL